MIAVLAVPFLLQGDSDCPKEHSEFDAYMRRAAAL